MASVGKYLEQLHKIFTTYFSMKDMEKEFQNNVDVQLFGFGALADASAALFKKELMAISPDAQRKNETDYYLCFMTPDQITENFLNYRLFSRGNKVLFVISGDASEIRKDEIKALLTMHEIKIFLWENLRTDAVLKLFLKLEEKVYFALAKKYSALRDTVAEKLILKSSKDNAYLSFVSSIPSGIPIIGAIAGFFSVTGETFIITANQVRLCLRIAGIYGKELDFFARMAEIWPVIAGAFGWRTLARALVGFLPLAGPLLKASIAYGGTYSIGQTAKWYYRDNKILSGDQIRKLYEEQKKNFAKKTQKILHSKEKIRLEKDED